VQWGATAPRTVSGCIAPRYRARVKKRIGCANAIYVVQQVVVEHFNTRGNTVFISSLDASKAFDRVDQCTLFTKLLEGNVATRIKKTHTK